MGKSFIVTEILCLLLGYLGVHRYYTGHIFIGIIQTLTFGGCGVWYIIDLVFISTGKFRDARGHLLEDYDKNIATGVLILVGIFAIFDLFNRHNPKTVINNSSTTIINTQNAENFDKAAPIELNDSASKRKVKFANATCTITENGHFCTGTISDSDKAQIKKIQNSMKKKPAVSK